MTTSLIAFLCLYALHQVSGQPVDLNVALKEVGNSNEPQITLQIHSSDQPREVNLVPGNTYEFLCKSSGGFTNGADIWFDDSMTAITDTAPGSDSVSAIYARTDMINSEKTVLRVQKFNASSHSGTYLCKKDDDLTRSITISEGNPVVILENINITLTESDSNLFFINALISSSSDVDKSDIVWRHNGTEIPTNATEGFRRLNNDVITIGVISFDFSGEITVTVTTDDVSTTGTAYVRVIAKPMTTLTPTASNPTIGDTVTLTCEDSNGVPSPSFSWSYTTNDGDDDTDIVDGEGGYTVTLPSNNVSILTISEALFNHSHKYACTSTNEAGTFVSYTELGVLLPSPSVPEITLSPPTGPYYSGSIVTMTCRTTLVESDLYNGAISPVFRWTRGDMEYMDSDERVTIQVTNTGLEYTSTLTLSTSIFDNGEFACSVKTTSSDNYNSSLVSNTAGVLTVEDPNPSLLLTPISAIVPNLHPYNSIEFTCTVDIPQQVAIQHTFQWLQDNNVIDDGNIIHAETNSTLRVNVSSPGNIVYSCCLHLPLHHSPITVMRNATITVTGPSSPTTPTDVTTSDLTHNSIEISWTIPSIVYSPEKYLVKYGTNSGELNLESRRLSSGTDFGATDSRYSVTLNYLEQDRIYYFSVVSENEDSRSQSTVLSFRTLSLDIIQIKAGPFLGCENGRVLDEANVISFMNEQLSEVVENGCGCTHPSTRFINATLFCTEANSNTLVYRSYIVPSEDISSADIISHISTWVSTSPSIASGVAEVTFDPDCDTSVSHIQDTICSDSIETESPTASGVTNALDSTTILLAVILGAVVVFLLFVVILCTILTVYQYRRIRSMTKRRRSDYSIVRRSSIRSSNRGSSLPPIPPPSGNDWKKQGDIYVTTECPAYLASYQPKSDMADIDREATPGIYDTVDSQMQGRGLRPPPVPSTAPPTSPPHASNPLNGKVNGDHDFKKETEIA